MAKEITYALTVNGSAASAAVLNAVKQIEVEDHATMADMLRIRLAVAVTEGGSGWTLLDESLFTRLVNLKLSVTVGSGSAIPIINAYVIDVDTNFSSVVPPGLDTSGVASALRSRALASPVSPRYRGSG